MSLAQRDTDPRPSQAPATPREKWTANTLIGALFALFQFASNARNAARLTSSDEVWTSFSGNLITAATTLLSIAHQYPINGKWIIIDTLVVSLTIWLVSEYNGMLVADVTYFEKVNMLTIAIFASKILLDINTTLCGARFQ